MYGGPPIPRQPTAPSIQYGGKQSMPLNPAQMMYNVIQQGAMSSMTSVGPHHTKQLEAAQKARMAGGQAHHHARVAASQQRMSNLQQQGTVGQLLASQQQGSTSSLPLGGGDQIPTLVKSSEQQSSWTALDMGGMMINHLHTGLFAYKFLTCLYLNHNNLTSLPPLISELKSLQVLNLTGNKLSQLPVELSLVVSLRELLLFDNQLTFIPPEFGQLYQLDILGLEGNPMSEPIGSMIIEKGTKVVIKYLRDSCPSNLLFDVVSPPPADREWIEIDDGNPAAQSGSKLLISETFTIMCYNTLCEKYATPQSYGYTPSWALSWDYRKDLLLQELLNYSADIICLQVSISINSGN
jgi:CCR4-NOT transcription complex subunit 6